jgi:hypothetical protein
MREEIGAQVGVGRLLWVFESFFTYHPLDEYPKGTDEIAHHELGLYREMRLPDRLAETRSFTGVELAGSPHEFALEFHWFDLADVADLAVKPAPLLRLLSQPLPPAATVVVSDER